MGSDMIDLRNIVLPCTDCTILSVRADIEYPDGSKASDVYAHHMSIFAGGSGIEDATCRHSNISLFYNVGNERTAMDFTNPTTGVKSGFYLPADTKGAFNALLWNGQPAAKEAYVTVDYQYLPGAPPAGFARERTVWMSIGQGNCGPDDNEQSRGAADFTPPSKDKFTVTSTEWVSPYEGTLLGTIGHMHDGGSNIEFLHNDVTVCESKPLYDAAMQVKDTAMFTTLKSMSHCELSREVKKGDVFHIRVSYDFKGAPGLMEDDGTMSTVMGAGTLYIAEKV
jgi:hypothetical protein